MAKYELVVICAGSSSDEDRSAVQSKIEALVAKDGGSCKVNSWGQRQLAYDIKDKSKANTIYRNGFYTAYDIEASGDIVRTIEDVIRLEEAVIRFLTMVVEESVVVKSLRSKEFEADEVVELYYKNIATLEKFVTERGKIVARRQSKLSAKNQRRLSREIKRARMLAMMPFTTQGQ